MSFGVGESCTVGKISFANNIHIPHQAELKPVSMSAQAKRGPCNGGMSESANLRQTLTSLNTRVSPASICSSELDHPGGCKPGMRIRGAC